MAKPASEVEDKNYFKDIHFFYLILHELKELEEVKNFLKDILTQFLMESVVMTLLGGLFGVILGISGAFAVSLIAHIPFVVSIPAIIIAVGVSTLVGLVLDFTLHEEPQNYHQLTL